MELLYIWIEDYKNIYHQGFNFSPRYRFEFNSKTNELTSKENVNVLHDKFFGDKISNVTAIVGDNGSGKTTLLNFILNWIGNFNVKQIIVTKNSQNKIIASCHSKLNVFSPNYDVINYAEDSLNYLENINIAPIFISFSLTKTDNHSSNIYHNKLNYSTSCLLEEIDNIKDKGQTTLTEYWKNENYRIVDFQETQAFKIIEDMLGKTGLDKWHIFPKFQYSEVYKYMEIFNQSEIYNSHYSMLEISKLNKSELKTELILVFYFSIIAFLLKKGKENIQDYQQLSKNTNLHSSITQFLTQNNIDFQNSFEKIINLKFIFELIEKKYFDELFTIIKNKDPENKTKLITWFVFVKKIIKILKIKKDNENKFIEEVNKIIISEKYDNIITLIEFIKNIQDIDIEFSNNILDVHQLIFEIRLSNTKIKEFTELYLKTIDYQIYGRREYLNIQMSGLSAGEYALIQNFARINEAFPKIVLQRKELLKDPKIEQSQREKIPKTIDSYLLLFDEIELYLHPDWNKQLLYRLLNSLDIISSLPVQVLITTHSPFLCSDLPKENIIFLKKGAKKDKEFDDGISKNGRCLVVKDNEFANLEKTFAQNIHTLLSNSFFLNDGLIGEFAKEKINTIKKYHEKIKKLVEKKETNFDELKSEYETMKHEFYCIQNIIGEEYIAQIIKNHIEEIEEILFGKDYHIKKMIEKFTEKDVLRVLSKL